MVTFVVDESSNVGVRKPSKMPASMKAGIRPTASSTALGASCRNASRRVLEKLESLNAEVATSIRNLMFVFEDLVHVDDAGIREIANRADKKALTISLKGASEAIRDRLFSNMSKRGGDQMKEEMDVLGAVRLREVERAQQEIVAIARKLEEEGLITTGAGAGEPYVT
jgi:flagellar motor switch protein FliG